MATAEGRYVGRSSGVDPDRLAHAVHLRDVGGCTADQIVAKTCITPTGLYRHMLLRPAAALAAAGP
ncbi:hypothetical protein ACUN7V_15140 [Quadrisphaera oryzae]|uniref:hypothetical protein n=1 Tax=Quadrisphaera TaxID=317661 RepID=UPI001C97893F|nr:hypothetical protein [Quadrisphaera sp. RL12-1S]